MRASSPPSGFSILITSAPMSASSTPASGPASAWPTSMTRIPSRGSMVSSFFKFLSPKGERSMSCRSVCGAFYLFGLIKNFSPVARLL